MCSLLNCVRKCHIYTFYEHFQVASPPLPGVPMHDNPFHREIFHNIRFKPLLLQIDVIDVTFNSIHHQSLGQAIQPVFNPTESAPVQAISSQFLQESGCGKQRQRLYKIQIENIHRFSLIYSIDGNVIEIGHIFALISSLYSPGV